ncbi:unnamed protein product [Prorocentrum cordatum]|uniref:Uncharacterized protein n=1 Tax=Prorocentrum cordatum TaxID=2364126 RepID=A0ABN9WID1_9DINO|nr:unnamed protein product [Polarella glacialis]
MPLPSRVDQHRQPDQYDQLHHPKQPSQPDQGWPGKASQLASGLQELMAKTEFLCDEGVGAGAHEHDLGGRDVCSHWPQHAYIDVGRFDAQVQTVVQSTPFV